MRAATRRETVPGPAGRIECAVDEPAGSARGIALIAHPHPLFGGTLDPGIAELSVGELLILARLEVETLLRIVGPPTFDLVKQWPRAIPQYELGHARRVARIEEVLARLPGLFVAGNGLHGVAFPRAARAGEAAAEKAVELLRGEQG